MSLLLRALRTARPHWSGLAVVVLLSFVAFIASLAPLAVLRMFTDWGPVPPTTDEVLVRMALILGGGTLAGAVVDLFVGRHRDRLMHASVLDTSTRLLEKLQVVPIRALEGRPVGELLFRVLGAATTIAGAVCTSAVTLARDAFAFLVLGGALLWLSPELTFLSAGVLAVHVALVTSFRRSVGAHTRRFEYAEAEVNAELSSHLLGARTVRAYGVEREQVERIRASVSVRNEAAAATAGNGQAANFAIGLLSVAWMTAILLIGGEDVISGRLSFGSLMLYFFVARMTFTAVAGLTQWAMLLPTTLTNLHSAFDLLDQEEETSSPLARGRWTSFSGRVEFRDVSFAYSPHRPVLRGVSFVVEPGQQVVLMGRSGAGKTTILNLLMRFIVPDSGQILLDGVDAARIPPDELRRQIGCVFQEPFLVRGSLRENVELGSPEAGDPERLERVLRSARLLELVAALPQGVDTPIGPGGRPVSAGERQRIAIARALHRHAPLLLLDEPTSSLDLSSERQIQEALAELLEGTTTLMVAHRLSSLRRADRVLVLDAGGIVEAGTHHELLAGDGLYKELLEHTAVVGGR